MSIIEGAIATKAALASKYRRVNKIYISYNKSGSDVTFITRQAELKHIEVEKVRPDRIEELASGKTHGGILADVSERKLQSLTSLLYKEQPFLALVEGVEDSYNLGYVIRSLYAFGCDGIILKDHIVDFDDSTIIKSSAGASEMLPICHVGDLEMALDVLKENGIRIISAYRGGEPVCLYDYDFTGKGILICLGGPLRGLSKTVLDNSDDFIYIPYASDFRNALNGSSAMAVIASEIFRQKSMEPEE
ncbi:MAG: RNA methyltransferase [Erysipelotrichaceae bacterium]|nr:RNA methyltransferase [Erysipelotrichaceae bacterium]MBR5048889.1 RNA methyltransferase [Erysipelotrichaceae bacterium]